MRRIFLLVAVSVVGACGVFGSDDEPSASPPDVVDGVDGGEDGNPAVGGQPADYAFTIDPLASTTTIVQGATAKVTITVKRGKFLKEPITITTRDLRDGVAAKPLTITGDSGELELFAPAAAAQGPAEGLIVGAARGAEVTTPVKGFVRGAPGAIDTTFGVGGTLLDLYGVDLGTRVEDLVVAPDDSLYVVSRCPQEVCVIHVGADGAVDKAYGTNGVGQLAFTFPHAAALQGDGKLVVVGGGDASYVGRLDVQGQPDTAFGTGAPGPGTSSIGTGGLNGTSRGAWGVALRADGDIFVGWDNQDGTVVKNGSMRLGPNGVLRPAYGLSGTARSMIGLTTAMTVRNNPASPSNGNLLMIAAVEGTDSFGVLQSAGDTGTADAQFGGSVRYTTLLGVHRPPTNTAGFGRMPGLVELPDGSIITPFSANDGLFLYKMGPTFAGAAGFGTDGLAGPFAVKGDATGIALQADGKILVALKHEAGQEAIRFTSNGAVDTEFGQNGHVLTLFGTSSFGRRVVVQKSGRIVLTGGTTQPYNVALTAYWP